MTWSVLADEHVKRVFVSERRANGYPVVWVSDGYDPGKSDTHHLKYATRNEHTILTNDTDFLRLHDRYDHAGLICYDDQNLSVNEFIRAIKRIERFVPKSEIAGAVVWLDQWTDE